MDSFYAVNAKHTNATKGSAITKIMTTYNTPLKVHIKKRAVAQSARRQPFHWLEARTLEEHRDNHNQSHNWRLPLHANI